MSEVTRFRLHLLRATYLLIVVGLGVVIWPGILRHSDAWAQRHDDTASLLAGVSVLALLGLRYPLQMLPLLLFELVWKTIWLIAIAWPLWRANQVDPQIWESIKACLMGVVLMPIVIPWPYVFANFMRKPDDRWR
jgi:hypothetical protein